MAGRLRPSRWWASPATATVLLLTGLLMALLLQAPVAMGKGKRQAAAPAAPEGRQRSDGVMRRLQKARRTAPPTPFPTPFPTYKPLTRRPTPVPDPNAPTRAPRRTRAPSPAPEVFEPPPASGSGSAAPPPSATTVIPSNPTDPSSTDGSSGFVDGRPVTPAPTPLPPPPPGGPSVNGAVGDLGKSFDWTPVVYAGVATGILCVVLLTIAVMVRVLRVRTPLTPSIAPSDLGLGASHASNASAFSRASSYASHSNSHYSIEEIEPSPRGLPGPTSAAAAHSPRSTGTVDASRTADLQ